MFYPLINSITGSVLNIEVERSDQENVNALEIMIDSYSALKILYLMNF